jgi:ABC-type branched-subunit amino acid transport system substrate-binding protein
MQVNSKAGWMQRWALAAAALAIVSGAAHAVDPGVSESEIVIGTTITLQGGKNAYGVAAHNGMKLYFDALNAGGGVLGRKIVMRTLDDDNKAATAEANARKLVREGAFLLFGPVEGGPSSAVMKAAAELKVPLFGPAQASAAHGVPCASRTPRRVPRPDDLGQEHRTEDGGLLPRRLRWRARTR